MSYFCPSCPSIKYGFASCMFGSVKAFDTMENLQEKDRNRPKTVKFPMIGRSYDMRFNGLVPVSVMMEDSGPEAEKKAIQAAYQKMVTENNLGYGRYGDGVIYTIVGKTVTVLGVGYNKFDEAKEAVDSPVFVRLRDTAGKVLKVFMLAMVKPNDSVAIPGGFRAIKFLQDSSTGNNVEDMTSVMKTAFEESAEETGVHLHPDATKYDLDDYNLRKVTGDAVLGFPKAEHIKARFSSEWISTERTSNKSMKEKGEVIPDAHVSICDADGNPVDVLRKRVHMTHIVATVMDLFPTRSTDFTADTFLQLLIPQGNVNEKNDSIGVRMIDVTDLYLGKPGAFEGLQKAHAWFFDHHPDLLRKAVEHAKKQPIVAKNYFVVRNSQ